MKPVLKAVTLCLTGLLLLLAGPARAQQNETRCFPFCDPESAVSSPDGKRIYFVSGKALVKSDRNETWDIYERRAGKVRLITHSTGSSNRRGEINIVSANRDLAFPELIFSTSIAYSPLDRDNRGDLYRLKRGKVRLLTADSRFGKACRKGCSFDFAGFRESASELYFFSDRGLVAADRDSDTDLYGMTDSRVELLSGGPQDGGSDSDDALWLDGSVLDNGKVYFQTAEPLLPEDGDSGLDIYANDGGNISLVSVWPSKSTTTQDYFRVTFSTAVPGRLYVRTNYRWLGSPVVGNSHLYLVDPDQPPRLIHASEDFETQFGGESPDGQTIYFSTVDALDPLDLDQDGDVYAWHDGSVGLFSTGPRRSPAAPPGTDGTNEVVHVSREGEVIFTSTDQLVAADSDWDGDLYRRSGDEVELLTSDARGRSGTGWRNRLLLAKVLDDGDRVLFTTGEQLVPEDRNEQQDLYLKTPESILLLSGRAADDHSMDGPVEGPQPDQAISGGRYLFTTNARLSRFDGDQSSDTYMYDPSRPAHPRLVSAGILATTKGPSGSVPQGPVKIWFRQLGPRPKFMCRIDDRAYKPCKSPVTYRGLPIYGHTFYVASVGKHGLGLRAAVTRKFSIGGKARTSRHELAAVYRVAANSRRALMRVRLNRKDGSGFDGLVLSAPAGNFKVSGTSQDAELLDADRNLDHIAFSTRSRLSPADDDGQRDVYIWTRSGIELFPAGINLIDTPTLVAMSDDGSETTFSTRSQLASGDVDQATDAYLLDPAGVRLASPGTASGLEAEPLTVPGLDGAAVFFTSESLVPEDAGDGYDLYWGDGDSVMLLASLDLTEEEFRSRMDTAPVAGSADGRRLILTSKHQLTPEDDDSLGDVYSWTPEEGLSFGSPGDSGNDMYVPTRTASPRTPAVSRDAKSFLFTTYGSWVLRNRSGSIEPVRIDGSGSGEYVGSSANLEYQAVTSWDNGPGDKNNLPDLFLVGQGQARRLTLATTRGTVTDEPRGIYRVRWISDQGNAVLFTTRHQLLPSDRDRLTDDVYLWKSGKLRLLSKVQPKAADDRFAGVVAGPNGGNFYIRSRSQLIAGDHDREVDIYRLNDYGIERLVLWPNR